VANDGSLVLSQRLALFRHAGEPVLPVSRKIRQAYSRRPKGWLVALAQAFKTVSIVKQLTGLNLQFSDEHACIDGGSMLKEQRSRYRPAKEEVSSVCT
jgi:hypothetical protein